jgi:hypothetical protein
MKSGNNYQGNREVPNGECWVEKRSFTKGVGEAQNEKEDRQVEVEKCRMIMG